LLDSALVEALMEGLLRTREEAAALTRCRFSRKAQAHTEACCLL
jgi:hypothetical protein